MNRLTVVTSGEGDWGAKVDVYFSFYCTALYCTVLFFKMSTISFVIISYFDFKTYDFFHFNISENSMLVTSISGIKKKRFQHLSVFLVVDGVFDLMQ